MFDLKATGPLYLVPVFVLVAERSSTRVAVAAAALGLGLAFAIFAVPPFSLTSYLGLLARTARHGLSARELALNAWAATLLLAPALVTRALRVEGPPVAPQRARWTVPARALLASAALVCVVAAKPGSGRHHLLPFLPLAVDALVDGVDGIERGRLGVRAARAATLVSRAVAAALIFGLVLDSATALAERDERARRDERDLRAVRDAHPGEALAMGYGDAASYPDTFERFPIALGGPLLLDGASQMDSTASGYPASRMLGATLERCRPRLWVLPAGEPFSMPSYYAGQPLFDAAFRDEFARRYALVERRGAYRVYRCRD
jgi:hypothetical protein